MKNLQGKIALVTGGNSGIGYASAKTLIEKGATVIITGRRKDAVDKAASALGATGLITDHSKVTDIETLTDTISRQFGKIDILVISAGITSLAAIEAATEAQYDELMNVNVKGAYFTLSRLIPVLNPRASVIIVSSSSASADKPLTSIYAASKCAVNAIVRIAAVELAQHGIRVNAVSPGPFATEIMEKSGLADPKIQQLIIAGVPPGRLGIPAEVGNLVSFLAGEEAAFITGAEYLIDGGQSLNR